MNTAILLLCSKCASVFSSTGGSAVNRDASPFELEKLTYDLRDKNYWKWQ